MRMPSNPTALLVRSDVVAGLLVILLGGGFGLLSLRYRFGSPSEIGIGFMPKVLSVAIVCLGVVILIRGIVSNPVTLAPLNLRGIAAVALAILVFAGAISYGLATAVVATTLVARLAQPQKSPLESLLLAVGLSIACVLVFIVAIGETIPIGPF